jgi:hypothetical protein
MRRAKLETFTAAQAQQDLENLRLKIDYEPQPGRAESGMRP